LGTTGNNVEKNGKWGAYYADWEGYCWVGKIECALFAWSGRFGVIRGGK